MVKWLSWGPEHNSWLKKYDVSKDLKDAFEAQEKVRRCTCAALS